MRREYEYRVHVVVDEDGVGDGYVSDAQGNDIAVWIDLREFQQLAIQDYRERQQAAAEDAADAKLAERQETGR